MKKKIFPIKYMSLKIYKNKEGKIKNKIINNNYLYQEEIKKNFVLIKVMFSNINYKDVILGQNIGGMVKNFPHSPGIDASGVIYFSNSKRFKKNDKVFIIARPLGIEVSGSFSQFIIVHEDWVDKLPRGLNAKEIMMMGTSGFTAVKAFHKSVKTILKHKNKPVLVTGATGNVGMFLILLLINYGINVEVITSKKENNIFLKKIGVKKIYLLQNFFKTPDFAMFNERYSVIFDNLGGNFLSIGLKYLIKKGTLVSIGNVLNNISSINILPFILREINILGINAELSSLKERKKIFRVFILLKFKKKLLKYTKLINLTKVLKILRTKNFNKKFTRFIVKI